MSDSQNPQTTEMAADFVGDVLADHVQDATADMALDAMQQLVAAGWALIPPALQTTPEARFRVKTDRGYCYGEEGGAYLFGSKPPRKSLAQADAEYLARSLSTKCAAVELEPA